MTEKGSSTLALDEGHVASPALFVEEITPRTKKRKTGDKGKEKVRASVWWMLRRPWPGLMKL